MLLRKRGQGARRGPDGPVAGGDAGTLFSSSLDKQQTTLDCRTVEPIEDLPAAVTLPDFDPTPHWGDHYIAPLSRAEEIFRHSGWRATRAKVNRALRSSGASAARVDRFEKCGSDCIIEEHVETGDLRLRANYCGDRFCTPCCNARGARIERELVKMATGQALKFATFTRRDDGSDLISSLNHLRASWHRLRQQHIWLDNVTAAAYAVEITRGEKGTGWHVHLHALLVSRFVDQRDWSAAWCKATNGSPIMDIRAVKDTKKSVRYLCKYATKSLHPSVLHDHDSTCEAMIALRGRRLVGTLGDWHKLNICEDYRTKEGWVRKWRLDDVETAAFRRAAWSASVLHRLRMPVTLFDAGEAECAPDG